MSWTIYLMSRVFTNGRGDWGSILGRVIPKTQKMVLDTALLSTQLYKVRIKGKVVQSREWSSTLPLHFGVVAIEKGAFRSSSTKVANFTYIYIYIYMYACMYKQDLAFNNPQWLIYHKTQPSQPNQFSCFSFDSVHFWFFFGQFYSLIGGFFSCLVYNFKTHTLTNSSL